MADIMYEPGADTKYGRGNQHANNKAGNGKLAQPTTVHDSRDKGGKVDTIDAIRETAPAKPGRGNHRSELMGG